MTAPRNHRKHWSAQELRRLRELYAETPAQDLARLFGRTRTAINQVAMKHGLRKTEDARLRSRFQPGQEPWNKGVPGSTGRHPRSRKNWFKPGRHPRQARNYRPIGALRISYGQYLQVKVTDDTRIAPANRWRGVHVLVWEQHHGPVPAGHIVVFRPGMHTTERDRITLDRLECISRAENMRRNSVHQHPPELVDLYYLKASITRKVNQIRKESK